MGAVTFGMHPLVNADVLALDGDERRHAVLALKALRDGDVSAYDVSILGGTHALLQLEGLRALRCGDAATAPLRVVYRQEGDAVEVIAVGPRQRSQVFQQAHYRLHPAVRRRRLRTHSAADWKGMLT